MKTKLLIGLAILQVLVLATMAAQREWVLRKGRTIYLRTAPVDPRDAMRGDYVRLNYQISRVPRQFWRGRLASTNETPEPLPRDTKVYAALRVSEEGMGELVSLSTEQPAQEIFVRGRTDEFVGGGLQVRYGLEAYFMEQGKGRELEQERNRDGIQVPLEMAVAVGSSGLAVLKEHRWCALGIGLDLESATNATSRDGAIQQRRVVAARVRLLNADTNDLAIVDQPGGRSLALVADSQWTENPWRWAREKETLAAPETSEVIVLKPGQTHSMRINFDDPQWSVVREDKGRSEKPVPTRLVDLNQDWSARFRLEYRPPERAVCKSLPNARLIWHGRLPSRAFNAVGGVD
ncbi:MAG TPA: GDYXXLXY domain-containing protein [Verrucomicrobiae bacterium]|nr:GDYXXLXY domain-containing protein [Verrucomicrobiae bacterium]